MKSIILFLFPQIVFMIFPWIIRKKLLLYFYNVKLGENSKIGLSLVLSRRTILEDGAILKNFCFINAIDLFYLKQNSKVGNQNWITGSSAELKKGYKTSPNRKCEFILGVESRVTGGHRFDCNGGIYIGDFTTIAGTNSEFLTHGINVVKNQQEAESIYIGDYCFIGTRCLMLKGSAIPNKSLVAGGAVVSSKLLEEEFIYGGVPAKPLKKLPAESLYFYRKEGNVY